LKLQGLDPDARYRITDLDVQGGKEMTGRELMEKGVSVAIPMQPGAVVIIYKRVKDAQPKR